MVAVYVGFSLLGEIRFGAWATGLDLTSGLFILLLAPCLLRAAARTVRRLARSRRRRGGPQGPRRAERGRHDAPETPQPARAVPRISDLIRFENVSFRYGAEAPLAIDAFDLHIRAGEHVALLGASGSGKSTLLALMAGLAPAKAAASRSAAASLSPQPHGRPLPGSARNRISSQARSPERGARPAGCFAATPLKHSISPGLAPRRPPTATGRSAKAECRTVRRRGAAARDRPRRLQSRCRHHPGRRADGASRRKDSERDHRACWCCARPDTGRGNPRSAPAARMGRTIRRSMPKRRGRLPNERIAFRSQARSSGCFSPPAAWPAARRGAVGDNGRRRHRPARPLRLVHHRDLDRRNIHGNGASPSMSLRPRPASACSPSAVRQRATASG
jgi:energy-coupling factor transporter ATP-binding protein EcfA2